MNRNLNKAARVAGVLYIFPWALSFVAVFLHMDMVVTGNPSITIANIAASPMKWYSGILCDLVVQVVFVYLVVYLYRIFRDVDSFSALLMMTLFLVSVPIAILNQLILIAVPIVTGSGAHAHLPVDVARGLVSFLLELHEGGLRVAFVFWGLWLVPLGLLAFRSGFIPRIIGIYIVIGCVGYVFDFVMYFVIPGYGFQMILLTGWGELFLCLWLLIRGVRFREKQQ